MIVVTVGVAMMVGVVEGVLVSEAVVLVSEAVVLVVYMQPNVRCLEAARHREKVFAILFVLFTALMLPSSPSFFLSGSGITGGHS